MAPETMVAAVPAKTNWNNQKASDGMPEISTGNPFRKKNSFPKIALPVPYMIPNPTIQ